MKDIKNSPGGGSSSASSQSIPQSDSAGQGFAVSAPTINLPKGGGAIRGIGEKFSANPVTGTGSMSVPITTSPGRSGFGPQLALSYDSGAGNGPHGLGWNLSLPSITRKTDKGLPKYFDEIESDTFILSGAEDLVPLLDAAGKRLAPRVCLVYGKHYQIRSYRPWVEGLFALIERWTEQGNAANIFWRTITRDNITTWYGRSDDSRIYDPTNNSRIYQWLICESYDDKGNVIDYRYMAETPGSSDGGRIRQAVSSTPQPNRYLKRIYYGNLKPYLPTLAAMPATWQLPQDIAGQKWMFEVVFDYGQCDPDTPLPDDNLPTPVRRDPFSTHRAGFEIRTYRLCRRVLMFHHFESEPGVGNNCLVRSTDFHYQEPATLADPNTAGYTVMKEVTHRSYVRKQPPDTGYDWRQLPPVTFHYSQPKVNQAIQAIAHEQLENLPVGTQGSGYEWIDLDGEGLPGVLSRLAGSWYYKSNLGRGTFGPTREVARQPAMAQSAGSRQQFMDLSGNGNLDVVDFSGPTPGFHERDTDEGWKRHVPFASLPNIDWQDPNLRFVDLTGDGHADALITDQDVFTWYPSLADSGFDAANHTRQATDEEAGPRLVFADGTQTIFLADMCGDGLTDLVRIRNSEVCYWPNLGYGRFGRKITLGNSPIFDYADHYDPSRIRLADIDGSGPIDLIYLGRDGARLYFNRSGNSLSDPLLVNLPVATTNLGAVQVADLLGNGTACLVWNSHLPADASQPVRYIDLMGGADESAAEHLKHEKPHLLIKVENNLGGTTEIEYTPSTYFYIQDKRAGTPWITRLPFPVHCVSKVTVRDKWRRTQFSSTYNYHHGYFDGVEREFRGFGRVEQLDVEDFGKFKQANINSPWITDDEKLYQPPVKTITWYHTGAALDRQRILGHFAHEYFSSNYTLQGGFQEKPLPDPELPDDLSAVEWREALRACKGMVLRQEVYELDLDDLIAQTPEHTPVRLFSAATCNCHIQCLQRQGENHHAVFLVTESEALSYHYELALPKGATTLTPDQRIAHTLNLRHDEYGNLQQSIAIGYPRLNSTSPAGRPADAQRDSLIKSVQSELHIAYSETRYTRDVVLPEPVPGTTAAIRHHRLRLPCEVKTYEITGLAQPSHGGYFDITELRRHAFCEDENLYPPVVPPGKQKEPLATLQYHQQPLNADPHRRIVEHARTLFFDDAADDAPPATKLAFGRHGPRGFKYEDYKLALTDDLLNAVFQQRNPITHTLIDDKLAWTLEPGGQPVRTLLDKPEISGYAKGENIGPGLAGQYWIRSGTAGFEWDATQHFYLPERYTDPFGNLTTAKYDGKYDLFIQSSEDALGNISGIFLDEATHKPRFDYRVLAPIEMADANGNRSEVAFDILGMVVASAVKGKGSEADNLIGFDDALANLPATDVQKFCTDREMIVQTARDWLGNATARFVYLFGEGRDPRGNFTGWAKRPAGACGIARERHASQVELDPARENPLQVSLECSDGSGNVLMKKVQAEPEHKGGPLRWIINGLTVLNNKGKPVKQYEPAFSPDFGCELPQANGVTPIMYYDAAGRVVRTEMPDGTFSRVEFTPWHVKTFDANDTILEPGNRWYAEHSAATASDEDQRAASLAAKHANTPAETHLDSLGREVIAIAHNRTPGASGVWQDAYYITFTKLDAEGKPLWICDARGNLVMQYITPAKHNHTPLFDQHNPDWRPAYDMPANAVPCYDIAGNLLYQHSMDAGDRWMLMDAAGKPMLAWDVNDYQGPLGTPSAVTQQTRVFQTDYDKLHRPTAQWLKINNSAPALIEAFQYCDTSAPNGANTLRDAKLLNLIGQAVNHWDTSGLATVERIDLSGQPAHVTRTLIKPDEDGNPDGVLDWNIANRKKPLEGDTYHLVTEYDALARMTRLFNWHLGGTDSRVAVYEPQYNARGLLYSEDLVVRAKKTSTGKGYGDKVDTRRTTAIVRIIYNAKGQKLTLALGNGTTTTYAYDAKTFRLTSMRTERATAPRGLQNMQYTYDPVGNITHINDAAQKTVFHNNAVIRPEHHYVYDALYRLIEGSGRENTTPPAPPGNNEGQWPQGPIPSSDQPRNYTQYYTYDEVGNFGTMQHAPDGISGWTRGYKTYPDSNRLYGTWYGAVDWDSATPNQRTEYRYDPHGNMLNLNSSSGSSGRDIRWDWRDMIRGFDCIGGGIARYHYGIDKQRTRKYITRVGKVSEDRIYLGGYERYIRRNAQGAVVEEIESLHLFEGEQRVLLVDDVIKTNRKHANNTAYKEEPIYRYQYSNHLGSACLELDDAAEIISYEEYHPYGTSAYRMMKSGIEAPAKRYRYTGMERDEESGLQYHVARYLFPSAARWTSSDPSGMHDGLNTYVYVRQNPIAAVDHTGRGTNYKVGTPINIVNPEAMEWVAPLEGAQGAETTALRAASSQTVSRGIGILAEFAAVAEVGSLIAATAMIPYELTKWGFERQENGRIFTERLQTAINWLRSGLMTSDDAQLFTSTGRISFSGTEADRVRREAVDQYTRTGALRELDSWRGLLFEAFGVNNARLQTGELLRDLEVQGRVSFQYEAFAEAAATGDRSGRVVPDIAAFSKGGQFLWIGDFKAGRVDLNAQTMGFVELAAQSEQRILRFFVPASANEPEQVLRSRVDPGLLDFARNYRIKNRNGDEFPAPVTIEVIPVPGFDFEDPYWQVTRGRNPD